MSEAVYASRNGSTTTTPIMGVAGTDGESYDYYAQAFSGGPDSNPLLTGRAKYAIYNEMRRSDPAVASLLWMFKLPIRQAVWSLDPPTQDGEDLLRTDALAWQFGLNGQEPRLDLTWDEQLSQAMRMLEWGAIYEEDIWGEPEDATLDEGRTAFVRPLLRCAPRSPSTIAQIGSDETAGTIRWIRQDLPGSLPIPGEKLTWFVFDREGSNWYGQSLLRPVFGAWRMKRALLISSAIAWDRWASGVPFVRHPATDEGQKRAQQIGRDVRVHERAYVAMPSGEEWGFSIESSGGMADPVPLLNEYDAQIAVRGVMQFMGLGHTSGSGSRAVAETQSRPAYQAVRAIADQLIEINMKQKFRRWMDVNFGEQYPIPVLRYSRLDSEPLSLLATSIANLANAGLTFSDRETQNDLRDRAELPPLPDETAATVATLPEDVGVALAPASIPLATIPGGPQGKLAREGSGLGL